MSCIDTDLRPAYLETLVECPPVSGRTETDYPHRIAVLKVQVCHQSLTLGGQDDRVIVQQFKQSLQLLGVFVFDMKTEYIDLSNAGLSYAEFSVCVQALQAETYKTQENFLVRSLESLVSSNGLGVSGQAICNR